MYNYLKPEDLISRQDAITLVVMPKKYRKYQTCNLDDAYEQGWFDLQKCIEKFPSADVRPVVYGRWLPCASTEDLMCSNCLHYWIPNGDQYDYHYCPNCGAEMENEVDYGKK